MTSLEFDFWTGSQTNGEPLSSHADTYFQSDPLKTSNVMFSFDTDISIAWRTSGESVTEFGIGAHAVKSANLSLRDDDLNVIQDEVNATSSAFIVGDVDPISGEQWVEVDAQNDLEIETLSRGDLYNFTWSFSAEPQLFCHGNLTEFSLFSQSQGRWSQSQSLQTIEDIWGENFSPGTFINFSSATDTVWPDEFPEIRVAEQPESRPLASIRESNQNLTERDIQEIWNSFDILNGSETEIAFIHIELNLVDKKFDSYKVFPILGVFPNSDIQVSFLIGEIEYENFELSKKEPSLYSKDTIISSLQAIDDQRELDFFEQFFGELSRHVKLTFTYARNHGEAAASVGVINKNGDAEIAILRSKIESYLPSGLKDLFPSVKLDSEDIGESLSSDTALKLSISMQPVTVSPNLAAMYSGLIVEVSPLESNILHESNTQSLPNQKSSTHTTASNLALQNAIKDSTSELMPITGDANSFQLAENQYMISSTLTQSVTTGKNGSTQKSTFDSFMKS